MKLIRNHAYLMKPPRESQKCGVLRESKLVKLGRCWERGASAEDEEALCPSPIPCPMHLIHLDFLYHLSYCFIINCKGRCFPKLCERLSDQANYQT